MDNVNPVDKNRTETKNLFLFEIDGDLYAISVEYVDQVMKIPPITPVPNAPRAIIGIFHLRGRVVLVLDLISRMGIPKVKPLSQNYLFVVQHGKDRFAILIDKPKIIARVPTGDIHPADQIISAHVPAQYIQGTFMYEEAVPQRRKEHTIIIERGGATEHLPDSIQSVVKPVVWLNLEQLLDQDDLQQMFTSQE